MLEQGNRSGANNNNIAGIEPWRLRTIVYLYMCRDQYNCDTPGDLTENRAIVIGGLQ